MYEIAQQVQDWQTAGREVMVGTVVATSGFSSREPGVAAAWTDGEPTAGRLVAGLGPERITGDGLVEVPVSADDAAGAGLSCGGVATILVQPATAYPAELWQRLRGREPLCLVTSVSDGNTELFTPETINGVAGHGSEIARLFGRGTSQTAVLDERTVVVTLWPVPRLVVVGDGLIADALCEAAKLLGWQASTAPGAAEAVAGVAGLQRSDAVVVLSHDRDVDGPVLAAALTAGVGYVGALGARHTQAARREWLTERGVAAEDQARIHGPAGLDLGAHTPAEIAVSIVAEILAMRSGASGAALRERKGPVHVTGVQAPPPRY